MNVTLSETLYHFTRQLDTLKSIIQSSKFLLSLNRVNWASPPPNIVVYQYAIPMVCFCETPLEFLGGHVRTFGNYGLGMKIEWAISHGIHNIIYVDVMNPSLHGTMVTQVLQHYYNLPSHQRYPRTVNDHLVGSTEPMLHREEREWRYIGEVTDTMTNAFNPASIPFTMDDIEEIICPQEDVVELTEYLEASSLEGNIPKIKSVL